MTEATTLAQLGSNGAYEAHNIISTLVHDQCTPRIRNVSAYVHSCAYKARRNIQYALDGQYYGNSYRREDEHDDVYTHRDRKKGRWTDYDKRESK